MSGVVWSRMDPAFPEPTGPHCEVCGRWTFDGDLCAGCARFVDTDTEAVTR